MREVFSEVARLESLLSTYQEDSEISQLNRMGAQRPLIVSRETIACVEAALSFSRQSHGAFDPTLVKNGHQKVKIDADSRTIQFLCDGLKLNLGGIGKGFALDHAAQILKKHGVHRALLNFGGQILALDAPPGHKAWMVPIRNPRRPDSFLGYYEVVHASISTSAAYERGPHIIDPHTGKPTGNSLSTTVCAPSATDADALSTTLDVLGSSTATEKLIKSLPESATLIVPSSGDLIELRNSHSPKFIRNQGTLALKTGS